MKPLSGIYEIKCIETNKVYIGSSQDIHKRWRAHRSMLNKNIHSNKHLQSTWNIYGENSFAFRVIEECDKTILLVREDFHIQKANACNDAYGYNFSIKAGSPMAGLKHSEEARQKMSKSQTGRKHTEETKKKMGKWQSGRKANPEQMERLRRLNTGRVHSAETRAKLSAIRMNPSAELRYKMGNASRGKKHSPERIEKTANKRRGTYQFLNPVGEVVTIFGLGKFCRENGLQQSEMSRVNLGKRKSHQGWTRVLI